MKSLLRKIKLIDDFNVELNISKLDFYSKLRDQVDVSSLGLFSDMGDLFSSSKNEYKGTVDYDGFKLKRKRRFFDTKMNMATLTGTYRQVSDKLIVESHINGFANVMIVFFVFALLFYSVFIGVFIFGGIGEETSFFVLPFILMHALFMFGIPYFIMRKSVKRFKYDIEREFHFIATKPLSL